MNAWVLFFRHTQGNIKIDTFKDHFFEAIRLLVSSVLGIGAIGSLLLPSRPAGPTW